MKSILFFSKFSKNFEKRAWGGCMHPKGTLENFICGAWVKKFEKIQKNRKIPNFQNLTNDV